MIIKSDQSEIQNYLKDASNTSGYCDAVYYPENVSDVVRILKEANSNQNKVTVCGNRTGLTGASVPKGGIVLSTEKMNKILEINKEEKYAIVEPGVMLSDFLEILRCDNLYYPPDPTELNCFIGGTVATNASGSKTFKYGPTRNFVLEIEVVLPTGETMTINRGETFANKNILTLKTDAMTSYKIEVPYVRSVLTKNAAGYFCKENMDAIDLFIGSEGTLGVISRIKLKLLNAPENILSSVIFFTSEVDGLIFIEKSRNISYQTREKNIDNSIDALALEFFDKNALDFLRDDYKNIPQKAESAVWFEQEYFEDENDQITEQWMDLIVENKGDLENSWIAMNEKDKSKFQEFRHRISTKVNEYISSNNYRKLGTDFAVPAEALKDFYFKIKKDVIASGLDFVIYGHFGDSHIHLNMLPKNPEEFDNAKNLYSEMCNYAIEKGGTFSAEHGVGKNKTHFLIKMYGEKVVKEMFRIKKTLDPNLILGYGNIFSTER